MVIPKLVLRKNGVHEPRNRNRSSLHRSIRARIALAIDGKWSTLYSEALHAFPLLTTPPMLPPQSHERHLRRCRQACQQGALGKAALMLLQTDPPVAPTQHNAHILQSLHPSPQEPVSPTPRQHLPQPITFLEADIRRSLKTLPPASAPGPDGLRPSVFKTLAHTPGGTPPDESVVMALTQFVNDSVDGNMPPSRQKWFAGATLIGLPKTDISLRPIAMGVLLRKFIGRLLMAHVARDPDLLEYLLPHQLAVGVSGGAEAVIHIVRQLTTALKYEDYDLLNLDASNAFNSISRQAILDEVCSHCPQIARWVHFLYGSDSVLLFGSHHILSRNGTQQGDPPGMLLFSLALQPLIRDVQQNFNLPLIIFYADNGYMLVPTQQVTDVISFLEDRGSQRGFTLNRSQTDLWWFSTPVVQNPPCTINTSGAISILGSPVGHDDACREMLRQRRLSHETLLSSLPQLNYPQLAFHLLRSCASACLFMYALRTTPPHLTHAEAIKFDLRQRRAFEEIHRPCTDDAWYTATLQIEDGGLGLTPTATIAEVAFVSSLLNFWHILKTIAYSTTRPGTVIHHLRTSILSHLQRIYTSLPATQHTTPQAVFERAETNGRVVRFQDEVSEHIHNARAKTFMPPSTTIVPAQRLKGARLLSSSIPESSKVFSTLPNSFLGTRAEPEIWKTMVDMRTGNPLFNGNNHCPQCLEGSSQNVPFLDELGLHAATCPGGFGATRRHNSVCQYLYKRLRHPGVALAAYREKPLAADLHLTPSQQRRMDLVIDDLDFAASPHGFDITVVSPHNANYIRKAAAAPGGAALAAERNKRLKYAEVCQSEGMIFFPLAIDLYGAIGPSARTAFWQFASHLARLRGSSPKNEYVRIAIPTVARSMQATAVAVNRRRLSTVLQ